MAIDKKVASKVLGHLDNCASEIEKITPEHMTAIAAELNISTDVLKGHFASIVKNIDTAADRIQSAAYGEESLRAFQAKVLESDADEKYMATFDNPQAPLETDADEEYMHKVGPSFNSKGVKTFDDDISSSVTNREEHAVRDLSEWTDPTKKQPSWEKGPAGKSTHQGSRKASTKTWSA